MSLAPVDDPVGWVLKKVGTRLASRGGQHDFTKGMEACFPQGVVEETISWVFGTGCC